MRKSQEWYQFRRQIGIPVDLTLLLGRSDAAAMWLGGLVAYTTGFEFLHIGVFRDWSRITTTQTGRPTLVIRFADGRNAQETGLPFMPVPNPEPQSHMLYPLSGRWGQSTWFYLWSVMPLPPGDRLFITASFEAAGIPEATYELDTVPILEAASRAKPLWISSKR